MTMVSQPEAAAAALRRPSSRHGGDDPTPASTASNDAGDTALAALVDRVRTKLEDVNRYLAVTSRRGRHLVHVTIVTGSLFAALTASPTLGGKPLADWLTEAFSLSTPSWRILCGLAAICSLAATVATRLHSSSSYEEHIARAQGVRASLEALEVGIESGHLSLREATSQYTQCVRNASFI